VDPTVELAGVLDRLREADPAVLADRETVVALQRCAERLAAVTTRAVAAFDAGRAWEADGARTASAWLAVRCRLPVERARRRVRLGRALRHMGVVEAAWLAGEVGEAQVRLLAAVRTPAVAECFARDESMLVAQAKTLGYRAFARCVAYWAQLADPEGTDRSAEARYGARRLHLSPTFDGTWALDALLDPISGAIVAKALGKIEKELFEADWAEARGRCGEHVRISDLARTSAQRRHDALVEMARRSMALPAAPGCPSRCSAWWWAMRPSPGGCASWPTGRWWPPATWPGGWVRRGWSGWSSTDRTASVTLAYAGASSPAPAGGRCSFGIGSASTPTARNRPRAARSTTSSPGPPAGPPPRPTAGWRAGSITASGTGRRRDHRTVAVCRDTAPADW